MDFHSTMCWLSWVTRDGILMKILELVQKINMYFGYNQFNFIALHTCKTSKILLVKDIWDQNNCCHTCKQNHLLLTTFLEPIRETIWRVDDSWLIDRWRIGNRWSVTDLTAVLYCKMTDDRFMKIYEVPLERIQYTSKFNLT